MVIFSVIVRCISAVKVDDGTVNAYSHALAGLSGKRSFRTDASGKYVTCLLQFIRPGFLVLLVNYLVS